MSPSKGNEYIEGIHRFMFDPGYLVCRVECSPFYSKQTQNFCGGCKEMDFLLYHPGKKELWLIEVKDYQFDARPKSKELLEALCKKVKDTLFLLKTASICAPEETPLEGVSLREFSICAEETKTIRLGFLLELASGKLFPTGALLANIHSSLLCQMNFIDPELVCVPITSPNRVGPWRVGPAQGDVSKRVEVRHKKREMNHEAISPRGSISKNKEEDLAIIPMWKKRRDARMRGEGGNHYFRRRRRSSSDREW